MVPSTPKTVPFQSHSVRQPARSGLTLLELMVVLLILVATALIVMPSFSNIQVATPGGKSQTPTEVATQATLQTVREAIAGHDGVIETLSHNCNALPRKINDLVKSEAPEHVVTASPELTAYDPVNKIGWRGPYVMPTGRDVTGEPTVVDGWGNELQLQIDFDKDGEINPTESKFVRVVSAGPNGEIETPDDIDNMKPGQNKTSELTLSECGDDLVMFLRYPDYRK